MSTLPNPSLSADAGQPGDEPSNATPPATGALTPAAATAASFWRALRGPQLLLLIGVFLLVASSLVLIAFNWASFSPILQLALLSGVCGGLWGLGSWVGRAQPRTGLGVQVAGGVLVPVVGLALSRPGVLDLPTGPAWLLTAAFSLVIFGAAGWRKRQPIFFVAACVSAANAVLAAIVSSLGWESTWLPAGLILSMSGLLGLSRLLEQQESELSAGPRWLAHLVTPVTLIVPIVQLFVTRSIVSVETIALTLWAGSAFYALAALLDRKPVWLNMALLLPLFALPMSLVALHVTGNVVAVTFAAASLIYATAGAVFAPRLRLHALMLWIVVVLWSLPAGLITLLGDSHVLWTTVRPATISIVAPLLLLTAAAPLFALHTGRMRYMSAGDQNLTGALAMIVVLPLAHLVFMLHVMAQPMGTSVNDARFWLASCVMSVSLILVTQRTRLSYIAPAAIIGGGVATNMIWKLALNMPLSGTVIGNGWPHVALLALVALSVLLHLRVRAPAYSLLAGIHATAAILVVFNTAPFLPRTLGAFGMWHVSVCALAMIFIAISAAFRRAGAPRAYAVIYEVLAACLLGLAAQPPALNPGDTTLAWSTITLGLVIAQRRSGWRWMQTLALLALDVVALSAAAWLLPGARAGGAGLVLLPLAMLQAMIGLIERRVASPAASAGLFAYIAAACTGLGAIALALPGADATLIVSGMLALTAAFIATAERNTGIAWISCALIVIAAASAQTLLGIDLFDTAHLQVLGAAGAGMLAIALARLTRDSARAAIWAQPSWVAALAYATLWLYGAVMNALGDNMHGELAQSLMAMAALLAALAISRRSQEAAMLAAAATLAACSTALYAMGERNVQLLTAPAGLYLLLVAALIRRAPEDALTPTSARAAEFGATLLLAGVTTLQMLSMAASRSVSDHASSQIYAVVLCLESLLLIAYGARGRLQVPFASGTAFFAIGVIWLSIDPLRALDKWVIFGALGLLMIASYVVLERYRQPLAACAHALRERIQSWR